MKKLILLTIIVLFSAFSFAQTATLLTDATHQITKKYYVVSGLYQDNLYTLADLVSRTGDSIVYSMKAISQGDTVFYLADGATGDGTSYTTPMSLDSINRNFPDNSLVRVLRGDTYNATVTLQSDITYCSYSLTNGSTEQPELYGLQTVDTWILAAENDSTNVYKRALPAGVTKINQLHKNGVQVPLSKFTNGNNPDSLFWAFQVDLVSSATEFTDAALDGFEFTGAYIVARAISWGIESRKITSMPTSTSCVIDIASHPDGDIYAWGTGDYYWIINDKYLESNSWCYTSDSIFLRLPTGENPNDYTIGISDLESGFYGDGVSNVAINNFNVSGCETGVSLANNNTNVSVNNCTFYYNYKHGIYAQDADNRNLTAKRNDVSGSNVVGIFFYGGKYHSITNNTVDSCAMLSSLGVDGWDNGYNVGIGINMYECDSSKLNNNTVSSIGYNGIMFAGLADTVTYNIATKSNQVAQDGAGMYSHVIGTSTYIGHNILHDNGVVWSIGTHGLYIDNTSYGHTLDGNIAYNNRSNGIYLNHPNNITVKNNLSYGNADKQFYMGIFTADSTMGNIITNNTWVATEATQYCSSIILRGDSISTNSLSGNKYISPFNAKTEGWSDTYYVPGKYYTLGLESTTPVTTDAIPTYTVIDTIGSEVFGSNNTFDVAPNYSNWFTGLWLENSPLDGGAMVINPTGTTKTQQAANRTFNVAEDSSLILMFTYDVISNLNDYSYANVFYGSTPQFSFGTATISTERSHHVLFAEVTDTIPDIRMTVDIGGTSAPDTIFMDNTYLYPVTATATIQADQTHIFSNLTNHPVSTDLGLFTKAVDGTTLTSPYTIPAMSAIVGIKQ